MPSKSNLLWALRGALPVVLAGFEFIDFTLDRDKVYVREECGGKKMYDYKAGDDRCIQSTKDGVPGGISLTDLQSDHCILWYVKNVQGGKDPKVKDQGCDGCVWRTMDWKLNNSNGNKVRCASLEKPEYFA